MKYTEQAVETLDDAGSVIANKNIEIEQLRQRVTELEKEVAQWKNHHETEVRRARILKDRTDMPIERVQAYEQWGKDMAERDKVHQYWQIAEGRCDALMQQRDELLEALEDAVSVAKDALDHWDQDRDMKVGKLLHALSGLVNGYDSRADAVHNAIASVKEK